MTTIRDLDDPGRGIITPDYEDLFRTQQLLGSFAAMPGPPPPATPADSVLPAPRYRAAPE